MVFDALLGAAYLDSNLSEDAIWGVGNLFEDAIENYITKNNYLQIINRITGPEIHTYLNTYVEFRSNRSI